MEKSFENPLYKMGSFLEIMSYYDYAHASAFLCRQLSKKTREVTRKWENALNETGKRISLYIRPVNNLFVITLNRVKKIY